MKKLPLLLLPLLSGAFVLQGADWEFELLDAGPGDEFDIIITIDGAPNVIGTVLFKTDLATTAANIVALINGSDFNAEVDATNAPGAAVHVTNLGATDAVSIIAFDNQAAPHAAVGVGKGDRQQGEGEEGEGEGDPAGELEEGEGEEEVGNRTPVVKNVTAAQVEGTKILQIFYDLRVSDGHPCVVTVKWSTDSGKTFPLTATSLVGEAGPGIDPGDGLAITWDMGRDWDNKFTDSGRIQIIASRIPHDYVPGGGSETGGHSEGDHSEGEGGNSETGT